MLTIAFLKSFLALFAMMNPIGNTGIFIAVTGDLSASFKLRAAIKMTICISLILVASIWSGTAILDAFGISLPAFQLAGGLIVLGIGFKMIGGGENTTHQTEEGKKQIEDVAQLRVVFPSPMIMHGLSKRNRTSTSVTFIAFSSSPWRSERSRKDVSVP